MNRGGKSWAEINLELVTQLREECLILVHIPSRLLGRNITIVLSLRAWTSLWCSQSDGEKNQIDRDGWIDGAGSA